ncbi:OmpA family protein [Marinibaculum pumilum]|uniref:OmpA family protein n=1 Tax=Marinibaculum pumilum TaxID=1766165 RepID=A0ABV7KUK3_9PROT
MVARLAAGLRAARSLAFVALLAPTLGACAYGVGDLFGEDPPPPPPPVFVPKSEAETQEGGTAAAGADQEESFPTLGQVPERPTPTTQPAEQTEISQSLAADRQNAQYTRERLTGEMSDGGDPGTPPPATTTTAATTTAAASTASAPASATTSASTAAAPSSAGTAAASPDDTMADGMTAADTASAGQAAPTAMAAADTASSVPAPPSAGGTMADESANVQRAIDSRSEITEGTARGSTLQNRSDRPVLQRTERLTAALNSPEASASEVDAFTRRMAAGSSASNATVAARRSYPETGATMQAGTAASAPEVSSARADELLAAKASAELAAYEAQEQGAMTDPAAPASSAAASAAAGTAAMADTTMQAARTPEPQLTTRTVSSAAPGAAGDVEQATQQAIDRQAMGQAMPSQTAGAPMVSEQVSVAEEVTPAGQVTVVETMRETVPAAPTPAPQPQSLADIYEAQLRASSASTLQQAAREGATLAAADGTAGAGYPQQQAAASNLPPAGSYRAAPAQAYPASTYAGAPSYAGASGYGAGTVVVSGSGTTGGTRAAAPAAYAAGAGYPGGNVPGVKAGTIRFNAGSSRLGSGDLETLRRIADQYSRFGGRVLVLGHASSRTGDMPPERHKLVNFDISLERAEAVAAQLGRYGIPTAAMLVEARSDMDPIYFEAMPAAEAANRRAEVYFLR